MSKDSEVPSQRACQRYGPRHVPAPVSPPNLLLAVTQLLPFAPLTSIRLEMPPRSSRRRRGSCDFLRMSLGSRGFPREQHSELCRGFGNGASACKRKPQNVTSPQNEDIRGEDSLISGQGTALGCFLAPPSDYFKAFAPSQLTSHWRCEA